MYLQLIQISVVINDSISRSITGSSVLSLTAYLNLPNICLFLILILLLVAIYIYAKKIREIKNASGIDINFMNRIRDYIHDGKVEAAHSLCRSAESAAGRLIDKGIGRIGTPVNDVYSAMECLGKVEGYKTGKGIQVLLSLAAMVIVIGILGSLFHLNCIAIPHQTFSTGSVSLINTSHLLDMEAGLIAGLVIYLLYRDLIGKLACFSNSMQLITSDFMDLLNEPVK